MDSAFELTVGDTRDKVETLTSIARRFEDLGKPKRARKALALAGSIAAKLERVDDPNVRASVGVETLALLAGAHADLGMNEQALTILAEARDLVEGFVIPKLTPSSSSSWDPVSSARHTRVPCTGHHRRRAGASRASRAGAGG